MADIAYGFRDEVVKEASDIIRTLLHISADEPGSTFVPVIASKTRSGFVCFMNSPDGTKGYLVRKTRQFISCRVYDSARFSCKTTDVSDIELSPMPKKAYEEMEGVI